MALLSINAGGASGGFLYSSSLAKTRICITAETPDFDNETIRQWQDEGFEVMYLPYNNGGKEYISQLRSVKEGLGVGVNYAVIAFGDAASFCLDFYLKPTNASRLSALISYYPTNIPDTRSHFPPSVRFLTHLAGETVDVTTVPTALGIQGKKRRATRRITPGIGTGERLSIGHPAYTYDNVQPGFAEHDLEEYDRLAAELAFTRTLQVIRSTTENKEDPEKTWEDHLEAKFFSMNLKNTMEPYVDHLTPNVTYTPTMSGGIGARDLRRFYQHHFLNKLPPSMRLRLLSRTIGVDRVVDELYASFEHTHEIPWMLPGVPPTNKKVEVVLVSIVSLRSGKLYSEHVYWDQASVLVQIGLLDPKLVPQGVQGIDRLPVVGKEAARRILTENPESEQRHYHNRLIRAAHAKHRHKNAQAKSDLVDESGAELRSEAEQSVSTVNTKGKGKVVQRESRPEAEREESDGAETETEQNGNGHVNGSANGHPEKRGASVEDDDEEEEL
ncbi:dienelactone hydrolase [Aspergillus clavatus NRRL 1]|uniref:Dienelactone hydrolase n=1 Tax=Aspergillus clavatus (strain ATCC 1007 / CBS 513.65 / DSM 816 / NCTC 3887 / NRRL 1 / QM 1276 / 107) TaxID=344612 RepID=A1C9A1_ASPCL|nr:dienelactone hydrolase [Aspergillus clavatus NRRL 1]EAW13425.1 dienelactone hydrolase [Aspergillus clavatus NRRL 1]